MGLAESRLCAGDAPVGHLWARQVMVCRQPPRSGHRTSDTADACAHLTRDMHQRAADRMDAILGRASGA